MNVSIVPYFFATNRGNAFGLQLNLGDRIFRDKIASGTLSLDGQGREIIFKLSLLQLRPRTEIYSYSLGLAIVVDGEPENLRTFLTGRDVIFLIPRDRRYCEPLGI